ncbi:MAG: DinB family protein [Gemmatimonadota bacterium]|jgi:uncharacterized damage-inducible protein DinB|nr:DinB family protein [Gemmatimonadota bacterium]MDQ3606044.1 DinB family protein [Gemmatimonadota bacterium]
MEMITHYERLFAYDHWANGEAAASLHAADPPPARALRLLAHIVAAQWVWLGRLGDGGQWVAVWPEMTLAECEQQIATLPARWGAYLQMLRPERLGEEVVYTNSKGEPWTNTVQDILQHVVMHSAYHRGQIAMEVRAAGHLPAFTDFIHAARQETIG